MTSCPCGSSRSYADCCEPFVTGAAKAQTAEQLMRSRYTAFSVQAMRTGVIEHRSASFISVLPHEADSLQSVAPPGFLANNLCSTGYSFGEWGTLKNKGQP